MAPPKSSGEISQGSNGLARCSHPPHLLSNRGSDRSSETVDMDYLSPPETPDELEDLPYKPCCSSSESLNMSQRSSKKHGYDRHKHKNKKKRLSEKEKVQLDCSLRYQKLYEKDQPWFMDCPDGQVNTSKRKKSEDLEDFFLQFTPGRRGFAKDGGSSVSIRAKAVPETQLLIITAERKEIGIKNLPRKSWIQDYKESTFNKAVRERLISRKTLDVLPSPPASITLSRPKEVNMNKEDEIIPPGDIDTVITPKLENPYGFNGLISDSTSLKDIDSMIKPVLSSFQRRTPPDGINIPCNKRSLLEDDTRRLSAVDSGVAPQSAIQVVHATKIDAVRQVGFTRHITFAEMRRPSLHSMRSSKKITKTPRASVYEVIWEGNQPLSRCSHSTTSLSDETCWGSIATNNTIKSEWSGDIFSKLCYASQLLAMARKKRSTASNQVGASPTTPIFQWMVSDAAKEAGDSPNISPTQSLSSLPTPSADAHQEILSDTAPCNLAKFPDVISFPPLLSRGSTSQWISPLPDISAPEFEVAEEMLPDQDIPVGADAHAMKPKAFRFRASEQRIFREEVELRSDTLSPDVEVFRRLESVNLLHPHPVPRLWEPAKPGCAIGSSSGTRRKSSTHSIHIKIDKEGLIHRSEEGESTWTKHRKDSGWPPARTPSSGKMSSMASSVELSLPGIVTPIEAQRAMKAEEDRLNLVEGLAPLLSKVDHAGIYQTMTGSNMDVAICEDRCRPHVCSESRYGSRVPSKDWIG